MDDDNWFARAGIEHRVAAMYEEALRHIADTEQINGDVLIARKALANAAEVGQRAVVEFEASRKQLIKMRRDTIEECAQHLEQRLAADNMTGASSAKQIADLIRGLVPKADETLQDVFRRKLRGTP